MAVLVYIESEENKFKKTAYEALSYGKALADKMGVKVSVLVFNCSDTESLKKYGADKIIIIDNSDNFSQIRKNLAPQAAYILSYIA